MGFYRRYESAPVGKRTENEKLKVLGGSKTHAEGVRFTISEVGNRPTKGVPREDNRPETALRGKSTGKAKPQEKKPRNT